eukprot:Skav215396  [mRNA]  locus=scaffold3390:137612:139801:- [translate_table: standard]
MGWLSSVGIMQEISENILKRYHVDPDSQLLRTRPVPHWMVNILDESRKTSRVWWRIYLDNFAAGQVFKYIGEARVGAELHALAELAWKQAGVLSSDKKRRALETQVEELGAFVDGQSGYLGGSPERFMKLIQATLWVLSQPLLSKKFVQVVAGRWIHVMQLRRATMPLLDKTWAFASHRRLGQGIQTQVRRELFSCLCSIPLIPLMRTDIKAKVNDVITASDASSTGIGGAFRVYDILGLRPMGLIHYDTHKPANRVVSRRWPQAEMYTDVRSLQSEDVKNWLSRYPNIQEVHVWAGFPCIDLSSPNAMGQGLAGPASGLFFEVLRIKKLLRRLLGRHILVKEVTENVASMKAEEQRTIDDFLELKPYHLDPAGAVPMHRLRLCWCSERLEDSFPDLEFQEEDRWIRVKAVAPYPPLQAWVEPSFRWYGGEEGWLLPTAMKAIPRARPPVRPAGIERCSKEALDRYQVDSFRYPPYQYQNQFIFYSESGTWRTVGTEEKELLMGYGWKHTCLCMNAGDINKSLQRYDDERHCLLGDSFSIYSFIIPAMALCKRYLPLVTYHHIALRMGMAPGFRTPIRLTCMLQRRLVYGDLPGESKADPMLLNKILLARTNHTGSDVRIASGEILNPKAHPRQSVEAAWWNWSLIFNVRWKSREHINLLELRSIFLTVQHLISHHHNFNLRIFHLTDS